MYVHTLSQSDILYMKMHTDNVLPSAVDSDIGLVVVVAVVTVIVVLVAVIIDVVIAIMMHE